jgi:arsenite-transporting ATPase
MTLNTENDPIFMFSGKGGVGKTTCAGATALHFADANEKTLAVSTDPTPSLSHIFEAREKIKPVKVLDSLYLSELGLDEVKHMWDKKFGKEVHEIFSSFVAVEYPEFIDFVTSVLPGLSDEFIVDYIRELNSEKQYQHIIWDTAPLGQTLGLLEAPTVLRKHLRTGPRILSKLKTGRKSTGSSVMDILEGWEEISVIDMNFLKSKVQFVIVTIPEALSVEQLDGIFSELERYEFSVNELVINNVIKEVENSEFLQEKAEQQKVYLDLIHTKYHDKTIIEIPSFPREVKGIERLREVGKHLFA